MFGNKRSKNATPPPKADLARVTEVGEGIKRLLGSSEFVAPPLGATRSTSWRLVSSPGFVFFVALVGNNGEVLAHLVDGTGNPMVNNRTTLGGPTHPSPEVATSAVRYGIEQLGYLHREAVKAGESVFAAGAQSRIAALTAALEQG